MPDRIIGILGGMGPQATVDLYREILQLTPARKDQEHIPVLIYSNPKIPDRTTAILHGGEDPLPDLIQSARILEEAGAGILTIPCNTAHYFLPALQEKLGIPILNMIVETLKDVKARFPRVRKVGLLAATGTVRSEIYSRTFEQGGVGVIVPDDDDQERVHAGIFQVKGFLHNQQTQDTFHSIGTKLVEAGAQAVILGCTEIPLAFDERKINYLCLNATRSLAQAAVDWGMGKRG